MSGGLKLEHSFFPSCFNYLLLLQGKRLDLFILSPLILQKIHHSEPKGQLIVDQVLMAAENLLQSGDEELKNSTNAKLKELKSMWEETNTYIVHCHR